MPTNEIANRTSYLLLGLRRAIRRTLQYTYVLSSGPLTGSPHWLTDNPRSNQLTFTLLQVRQPKDGVIRCEPWLP